GGGFDPTALEDAVALMNEMPRGTAGQMRLQQLRTQEYKIQDEHRKKLDEVKEYCRQADQVIRAKEAEEGRSFRKLQGEHEQTREQYKDQLRRKLDADARTYEEQDRCREARMAEEAAAREDQIRRQTLEYAARLRQQTDQLRVKAETEGGILAERKNHDIRMEQLRQDRRESRQTLLESIRLAGATLGGGASEFLANRQEMTAAVVTLSAAALGIYAAKTGTGVAGRFVEARLGRPSLVRETSRRSALDAARHPWRTLRHVALRGRAGDALAGDIKGGRPRAIFDKALEARLRRVAESSANTRRNRAPFRHLLLYGPPGTGKTLFAKGLAQASGMDYAIMTGGDIAPLGREAVSEMHKVFDWAQTSRRGVVLFVDEADAFLRRRSTEVISEDMRNALNAFLYRTGEATDRFMVVYASNQPEQFDDAINDRIDELVPFDLPGVEERRRMLDSYMLKYLLEAHAARSGIAALGVEEHHMAAAAAATEGFSGREISKLAIAWQAAAYGSEKCEFTPELMEEVLQAFLAQKATKQAWDADAMEGHVDEDAADGMPLRGYEGMPRLV
ncbi:hypothetical protein JKP88DRAFT_170782, partial [Tribonema minus]